MVSAPGQPMKSSNTMRGAAAELVNSDMPLYTACPCRNRYFVKILFCELSLLKILIFDEDLIKIWLFYFLTIYLL